MASETLDLHTICWEHTSKSHKAFLPSSASPLSFPLKKVWEEAKSIKTCPSAPHPVKGFAEDITIISPSFPAHNCALKEIDKKANEQRKKISQLGPQVQT